MSRTLLFLIGLWLCVASDAVAATLTSVDVASKNSWRYFHNHNSGVISDEAFHQALIGEAFYVDWTSPGYGEPPIAGNGWQTGTIPIGYGDSDRYATALPNRRTPYPNFFLRKSFTVPDTVTGPFAFEMSGTYGFVVYLDGEELTRQNCCLDVSGQTPIEGPPQLLDQAVRTSGGFPVNHHMSVETLSAEEHTLSVSVHGDGRERSHPNNQFDMRVYSVGNERPWISQDFRNNDWADDSNWLVGPPGPDDFAAFPRSSRSRVVNNADVTVAGLKLEFAFISGDGSISLGSPEQTGTVLATGSHLDIGVRLQNDADFNVEHWQLNMGHVDLLGHRIDKFGAGQLRIDSTDMTFPAGHVHLHAGGLLGGTIHGDVTASGGNIELQYNDEGDRPDMLTITGDVSAPVVMYLQDESTHATLDGGGRGNLHIDELTVDFLNRDEVFLGSRSSYRLFTGWDNISIAQLNLADVGMATWDTSRLSEGILSIENSSCDYDGQHDCDRNDLDFVMADIHAGDNNLRSDVNNDGVVDLQDRDRWLASAATANGLSSPYLPGDANLDGRVNASDLMQLGSNWLQGFDHFHDGLWSSADFNADGIVDVQDLNEIGRHWQFDVGFPREADAAVPEPMGYLLLVLGAVALFSIARRSPRVMAALLAIAISLPHS